MSQVTAIRAVNFPVEDEEVCREFYGEALGMALLPDVLPDGTMCRWDRENDQFVGLRPRGTGGGRRWRYPYGRCGGWDHVELYVDGEPDAVSPVETHSKALVLADPEERAIEALLTGPGGCEVPDIAAVGLSVVDVDPTRAFYERLGFESVGWDGDGRFVQRADSGQRWVLVPADEPGFHHVTFAVESPRFHELGQALSDGRHHVEESRIRAVDPEGREVVLVEG